MGYLILQIILCLILAVIIGFLVGWFLKIWPGKEKFEQIEQRLDTLERLILEKNALSFGSGGWI